MSYQAKVALAVVCVVALGVAMMPQSALAQIPIGCTVTPAPQQTALTRPIELGTSGGNIKSLIKTKHTRGCFSGTLGSMVEDADENEYILSNNHVLADINKAKPGQLILQPGLIDVACVRAKSNAVATFSSSVKIKFGGAKNQVDTALAAVVPGQVSPYIMFVGGIADTVVGDPSLGMPVQKMGRTSCLTTGTVAALDANVTVNYSDVVKHPRLANFINQILVTGSVLTPTFGAAGDSGSLIVSQDDCPQAVALLFAGNGNGLTIANPITSVLSATNTSMVGTCSEPDAQRADDADADLGVSTDAVKSAKSVRDRHEDELKGVPGVVGTGIGADETGHAEIQVYVEKLTPQAQAAIPAEVEGTPVKAIETGAFVAY
ncbi:MAG TPA: hypothetical protein VK976_16205 [Verrucomicrobiae bacterium]|nr:hypothetical protein [Verrucomicrobiae bacterium]